MAARKNGSVSKDDAYRDLLTVWTRESSPFDWSETQERLGDALLDLGERESGTAHSLADFYLLPSTYSFSFAPEAKAKYPKYPAFCRWRERMEALPTVKKLRAALRPSDLPPVALKCIFAEVAAAF